MNVSALVVASLPIPATALALIPAFKSQRNLLSVYTSLFCFLTLGFIFSLRHIIARAYFPGSSNKTSQTQKLSLTLGMMPLFLILASATCAISYQASYRDSCVIVHAQQAAFAQKGQYATAYLYEIGNAKTENEAVDLSRRFLARASLMTSIDYDSLIPVSRQIAEEDVNTQKGLVSSTAKAFLQTYDLQATQRKDLVDQFAGAPKRSELTSQTQSDLSLEAIPFALTLMSSYVAMFVFAEAAFILMAIREYLQDLLKLSEDKLIYGSSGNVEDLK